MTLIFDFEKIKSFGKEYWKKIKVEKRILVDLSTLFLEKLLPETLTFEFKKYKNR